MGRIALTVILAVSLAGAWSIPGKAQDYSNYTFKAESEGFKFKEKRPPASGLSGLDVTVARPVGLATVIAGTGVFIGTLIITAPGGNVGAAADALIVRPGGWTFDRPLGQESSRWDEPPLF